ncbi:MULTISPECIES: RES family NAD+ phosphorylase [unclassified Psychrobacter]|uniref:RES family NAD+ phosphorylase n=1 Tax=unclassified Psychrobacter TaxID=196806 RepID=UPI002B1BD69E|nr:MULTISPECIES: RES family NAD+ phosphorylase [unclassified Psychrobacter]
MNIESIKNENFFKYDEELCFYCGKIKHNVAEKEKVISRLALRFSNAILPLSKCPTFNYQINYLDNKELKASNISDMLNENWLGCENLKNDVLIRLKEDLSNDDYFVYNDGGAYKKNDYDNKWSVFLRSIHYEHRFFNHEAKEFLDSLFSIIHENDVINYDMIYELNPNIPIFRARIANKPEERARIYSDPANELGAAPVSLAGEQRMTPQGISAFYGSDSRDIAFSEIRAAVGDVIMSAEFRSVKTLRLLDLNKLIELKTKNICPFNKNFVEESHKTNFIKNIKYLLSKPASEKDKSVYLRTQVIFEYLYVKFGNSIHGILFNSVQNDMSGNNFAIFPKCSKVKYFSYTSRKVVESTEIISGEYGLYMYYLSLGEEKQDYVTIKDFSKEKEYLEFIEESLQVDYVSAVITRTKKFKVDGGEGLYEWEKR